MRKVLAFLVCLFSFWTWKDFFVRWLRRPPLYPASGETAGSEHLPSQEGHPESEWARFLSSLPEHERWCRVLAIEGDSDIELQFGPYWKRYSPAMPGGFREFLGAVVSSEVVLGDEVLVILDGDDSLKPMEAFAAALRQSGNAFRKLELECWRVSPIPLAKCISSVLSGNAAIQYLALSFWSRIEKKIGKEVAMEFMDIFVVSCSLQILKRLRIFGSDWDNEGMEQLVKPFSTSDSVLERLIFESLTSDAQLEHIGGLLVASMSLKTLFLYTSNMTKNELMRGYTKMASALCSNRSLQFLSVGGLSSMELKILLDPLLPKTNNIQLNTTLTHLVLMKIVGGKEGIETLVNMVCTNTSLVDLRLFELEELSSQDAQAIENIFAILEALKTNKSLKKIDLEGCSVVGGCKMLGAMMDLLLENHCSEDIGLRSTGLEASGDVEYVYSALSKRKKMKLWGAV